MGYCIQYFRYFQGYRIFRKFNYGDICQFIRDTARLLPGIWDIGYPPIQASLVVKMIYNCKNLVKGFNGYIIHVLAISLLKIFDTIHFTSMAMGYCLQYFC